MTSTPTISLINRTIKLLEQHDWMAQEVEVRIPHTVIRRDLYGVGDVEAVRGHETLLVQVTDMHNNAAHIKKVKAEPRMHKYLYPGNRTVQVWAWRKLQSSGRWEPKVTEITLADLDPVPQETV